MGKKKIKNANHPKKSKIKFNILNFDIDNYYLFIITRFKYVLSGINDYNRIKPTKEEVISLQKEIDECTTNNQNNKNLRVIQIKVKFYDIFENMKPNDLRYTEYGKKISFIIQILKEKKEKITLKKIAEHYLLSYNKKISISTVSRILKNHLNIRYLKTAIKNAKLDDKNYMIMSFTFLRGIFRSLFLKLNLIFVDETGFLLENNNYYIWRNPSEEINQGAKNNSKERMNLILAVSSNKIIAKKFVKQSVDSKIFINFLSDLLTNINDEEKNKIMIVYDNATYHVSNDVIQFFKNNKIKGITNCPYRSNFNMIELVFRYIKNIVYKNIYSKMDDLKNDVINILESENLRKSLVNLYKETIEKYIIFIQKNNDFDLN